MFIKKNVSRRAFLGGMAKVSTAAASTSLLTACNSNSSSDGKSNIAGVKVAMLADVHFHDVFGDYEFSGFNNEVTMRSMQDSVESTRMFNENYFAFIEALEELGQQNIKYICLLGDFSDDGQVDTLKGFNRVVKPYIEKYGFEFFIANGNHDPVRPYGDHQTKRFLNHVGASVEVTSDPDRSFTPNNVTVAQHQTDGMFGSGYDHMYHALGEYGLQSKESYYYYETPWGSEKFEERGLYIKGADGTEAWCPDATYLAEPTEGLWICSVDMNVYLPKEDGSWSHDSIGWEDGKVHKKPVFDWLADVNRRADELGKTLVVFSHYPSTEYLNSSANDFFYLFDDSSYNDKRVPNSDTSDSVIDAGVKLQFAGHIHVNDTCHYQNSKGTLINVQAPSLAAYSPSYKVITCHSNTLFEIETKTLEDVRDFDALFPHYQEELEWREFVGADVPWKKMLDATNYRDFMFKHLDVLMNVRLMARWGEDMLLLANHRTPLFWTLVLSKLGYNLKNEEIVGLVEIMTAEASDNEIIDFVEGHTSGSADDMIQAIDAADAHCEQFLLSRNQLMEISFDQLCLITLYQRNADEIALEDLNYTQLIPIKILMESFKQHDADGDLGNIDWDQDYVGGNPAEGRDIKMTDCSLDDIKTKFAAFARIYHQFSKAQPADHFYVDLQNGSVEDLAGNKIV